MDAAGYSIELGHIASERALDIEGDTGTLGGRRPLDTEVDLVGPKRRTGLTDPREVQRARLAVERAHAKDARCTRSITVQQDVCRLRHLGAVKEAADGVCIERA